MLQPHARLAGGAGGGQLSAPVLDDDQQAVVDHDGGPLLVLAGPGTGKTTTLVESVVDRVERRGLHPEQVLVLTFSRKAADQLRARITARLGRTTSGAVAMTFHSSATPWCAGSRSPTAAPASAPKQAPAGRPAGTRHRLGPGHRPEPYGAAADGPAASSRCRSTASARLPRAAPPLTRWPGALRR